jgi:hypothetical protein
MSSKSSTFILIVVVLMVVGGLVYFFGIKKDSSTTQITPVNNGNLASSGLVSSNTGKTTGVSAGTTGTTNTGDQVVALLRNLSVIQLNDAVFQNPGFSLLRDLSITLPPVNSQGRRNPFAPISGDNSSLIVNVQATSTVPVTSGTGTTAGSATGAVSAGSAGF